MQTRTGEIVDSQRPDSSEKWQNGLSAEDWPSTVSRYVSIYMYIIILGWSARSASPSQRTRGQRGRFDRV